MDPSHDKPLFSADEVILSLQHYFPDFSPPLHAILAVKGTLLEVASGTLLVEQGSADSDVFLLLAGRLNVEHTNRYGEQTILNTIHSGEFFGEMSAFLEAERTASIRCTRHSILLKFEGDAFDQLLDHDSQLLRYISGTLIKRLADSNNQTNQRLNYRHISVLPAADRDDYLQFTEQLYREMSVYGSVLRIDLPSLIAKEVWAHGRTQSQNISTLFAYVYKEQSNYDYTLLIGEPDQDDWMDAIVGQSDKTLIINDSSSKLLYDCEKIRGYKISDKTVIQLRQPSQTISSDTALKVSGRVPHLYVEDIADVRRVARYVTGNAIKLVLGGGGARGIAHLGVYRAMLELGIPVDFVGGTSIGSIMAVTVATGWPYEEAIRKAKKHLVDDKPLKDYRMPMISLLSGKKMERSLYTSFGESTIESLLKPCFAVAANLSKAKTEIINTGKITNAIRSSISLPGIFPPAVHEGCLMLDGGIVDNLPFDHINTLADGPTIGVDLSYIKVRELGYEKVPSTRAVLMDKITKKKRYKVPNIYQTIMGTLTLASNEKRIANENKFDVIIKPDVAKFGFLNFEKFDDLVELGYEASFDLLRTWQEAKS